MKSKFRRLCRLVVLAGVLFAGVRVGYAQRIWAGGYGRTPPRFATPTTFVGGFNFCRGMYTSNRPEAGGTGWDTDYPGADINFSIRLGELTKTYVSADAENEPNYVVVRLTDAALFRCPFVILEDAGTAHFSNQEVARLREYLLKGGFILVADYWGTRAKEQWDEEIARVLPPGEYPTVDVPMDHPIWRTLFDVRQIPQVSAIQFWQRTGGQVSERGPDSPRPDVRGIMDDHGRLLVLMLHNTDVPDGWEREGEDREYFYRFSPDCYAIGLDIVVYAMTH